MGASPLASLVASFFTLTSREAKLMSIFVKGLRSRQVLLISSLLGVSMLLLPVFQMPNYVDLAEITVIKPKP